MVNSQLTLNKEQCNTILEYLYKIVNQHTWESDYKGNTLENEVNNYVNCKGGVVNSFSNWINEKNSMDYSRFVITKSQELLNFNITLGTSRDLFNQKKLINMITRECEIILGIYETPYYPK